MKIRGLKAQQWRSINEIVYPVQTGPSHSVRGIQRNPFLVRLVFSHLSDYLLETPCFYHDRLRVFMFRETEVFFEDQKQSVPLPPLIAHERKRNVLNQSTQ